MLAWFTAQPSFLLPSAPRATGSATPVAAVAMRGQVSMEAATADKAGKFELRVADDGYSYTRGEFVDYYGGSAEWDAAPQALEATAAQELCAVLPDGDICQQIYDDADAVFTVIDENGDGSISVKELQKHLTKAGYNDAAVEKVFSKLDTDGDGELSNEELRLGFLNFAPLRAAPGLGAYNAEFIDEIHQDADTLFKSIDADNNGTISKEELREHLKTFSKYSFKAISRLFKLLDANGDGVIERDELRQAFVKYSALRQAVGEGPNFK